MVTVDDDGLRRYARTSTKGQGEARRPHCCSKTPQQCRITSEDRDEHRVLEVVSVGLLGRVRRRLLSSLAVEFSSWKLVSPVITHRVVVAENRPGLVHTDTETQVDQVGDRVFASAAVGGCQKAHDSRLCRSRAGVPPVELTREPP